MFKLNKKHPPNINNEIKGTIDAKHNEILNNFNRKKNDLPIKYKELRLCQSKYNKLEQIPISELQDEDIDRKFQLNQKIEELLKEIDNIENNTDELDYFLNTSHILYQYYDNLESIANSNDSINFINANKNESEIETEEISNKICDFIKENKQFQRAKCRDEYLKTIYPNYQPSKIHYNDLDICEHCGGEKIFLKTDGYMVCEKCGISDTLIIDSDRPSYKDPPPEATYFAYKRLNHFNEILQQAQARQLTNIPQNIIDELVIEIKKDRIDNLKKLSVSKVKNYLKKLGYAKYYEHATYIIYRLNGIKPPMITPDIEEKLRKMFRDIQEPFSIVCPKERKNFLNYNYIFYKFVELLGRDDLKMLFPLLKSREKLYQQDMIWMQICKLVGYEFIRSV